MIITCFYLNTNYELNKKWESGIRGIIMFMIIIFMIKSEIKFCVEFSFGYIFLQIGNFFVNLQIKCHIRCACCPPAGGKF